ncbi:hypothetical protein FHR92_002107 [Fontibacillus solani]|uniref:Uncharacterized protein n=1 Tax=Fontibacillus solani TaxID=1572857 RepID=A0A7W3XRM6_9BACL|nr:hypothetical protein [Fontibacillus solani]
MEKRTILSYGKKIIDKYEVIKRSTTLKWQKANIR